MSVQWVTNNPDPRMILEYIVRCKNNFGNVWNKKIYLYMVKKIAANLHHTEERHTRAEDDDQVVGSC